MRDLSLRSDREKALFDVIAPPDGRYVVASDELVFHALGGGEYAHAAGTESLEQCAVVELSDHTRSDRTALEPAIEQRPHSAMS